MHIESSLKIIGDTGIVCTVAAAKDIYIIIVIKILKLYNFVSIFYHRSSIKCIK